VIAFEFGSVGPLWRNTILSLLLSLRPDFSWEAITLTAITLTENDVLGQRVLALFFSEPQVSIAWLASMSLERVDLGKMNLESATNHRAERTVYHFEVNLKTKEAVDYLVQSLESGQSAVLTQYLGAMAKFRNYSFGNISIL
jgi:hypothetical protein